MLKTIFTKIINNENDFSQEEKSVINEFIKKEVIILKNDKLEISSKFRVGFLKIEKNFALLKDLQSELKDIKLDVTELNGAYNKDFILVKRVFNPRTRFKAKIIEVLDSNESDLLVYVNDKNLITIKEQIILSNKNISKLTKTYNNFDVLLIN